MTDRSPLQEAFEKAGQGHVFRYFDELEPEERSRLIDQASEVDLKELENLVLEHIKGQKKAGLGTGNLEPARYIASPKKRGDTAVWAEAEMQGAEALRAGRVAAFTVAGGQGTRLGFDGPKGTFPITPVRGKPLFRVFAEKILATARHYKVAIPWFIMTSEANHIQTIVFFRENGFFGLEENGVHFFKQGRMPAVDFDGKILLETQGAIAMSPDGHGGSLRALVRSGALEIMRKAGIDIISYFQVDNPLLMPLDPAFIGFHLERESEMSSKMVGKTDPGEKVGVFCLRGDQLEVIEYSDLPVNLSQERESSGQLRYLAGSIAIHLISREFAQRAGGDDPSYRLPFHRAEKKVACVDSGGATVNPQSPNGVKFEMFVFDALRFAKNPLVVETLREEEFSPVKNATGVDSAQSCSDDMLRQWVRWLEAAGVDIQTDETGLSGISFEISPLFADSEKAFLEKWKSLALKPPIVEGFYLE